MFGGGADRYAIIPAASYGISVVARAVERELRAGDQILVIDEEFPSQVLTWRRVAAETGAQVVTAPMVLAAEAR